MEETAGNQTFRQITIVFKNRIELVRRVQEIVPSLIDALHSCSVSEQSRACLLLKRRPQMLVTSTDLKVIMFQVDPLSCQCKELYNMRGNTYFCKGRFQLPCSTQFSPNDRLFLLSASLTTKLCRVEDGTVVVSLRKIWTSV